MTSLKIGDFAIISLFKTGTQKVLKNAVYYDIISLFI